jgi:hypothetical protein
MQVHAFIDYDNLPRPVIQQGLLALARTLDSIITTASPDPADILLRLYGGWYNGAGLTNTGSLLVQEIYRNFPPAHDNHEKTRARGESPRRLYELTIRLLRAEGVPVWEVATDELFQAFAIPPVATRHQLRTLRKGPRIRPAL